MRKYDKEKMCRLYDEWKTSGMSMKSFSLGKDISPATFNYWARSIEKDRHRQTGHGFLRVPMLQGAEGAKAATINFPSGTRLDLYHPVEASFIKELVG